MRLLQAVRAAKSMAQTQLHIGRATTIEPPGTAKAFWTASATGGSWKQPMLMPTAASNRGWKPRAVMPTSNGSFKHIAAGELGYIQAKHIFMALPEDGERPVKTTRKVSVDGWDRADEEETRPDPRTRRQLERMHTVFRTTLLMCIAGQPQFAHLRLSKETLEEWYEWFYMGKTSRVDDPPQVCRAQRTPQDS